MKGSWKIARLLGIDVYMHWTFLLLIVGLLGWFLMDGKGLIGALAGIVFVLAIFACVVLHELGHAMAARRYGVPTRDITLLPIGGVARLQRMPEHPLEELVVAVAGPLVNVVIAAVLFVALLAFGGWGALAANPAEAPVESFFGNLMLANIILVVFNMLPAFPMDGGRVLRALLAIPLEYTRATNIAAAVGQGMAILFGLAGILNFFNGGFVLMFIALFVYLGAEAEARMVQIRMLLRGVPVRVAMLTRFKALSPRDSLQTAADELLAGSQQDFPVLEDGEFRGMLRREDLVNGLREGGRDVTVGQVMTVDGRRLSERDMLDSIMEQAQEQGRSTYPVLRGNQLVGLLTMENIGEMMMIRSALGEEGPPDARSFARAA